MSKGGYIAIGILSSLLIISICFAVVVGVRCDQVIEQQNYQIDTLTRRNHELRVEQQLLEQKLKQQELAKQDSALTKTDKENEKTIDAIRHWSNSNEFLP